MKTILDAAAKGRLFGQVMRKCILGRTIASSRPSCGSVAGVLHKEQEVPHSCSKISKMKHRLCNLRGSKGLVRSWFTDGSGC